MTWLAVFFIFLIAMVAAVIASTIAFVSGWMICCERKDDKIKKEADKLVDGLLKEKIGKTIAGINDGKKYNWQIHFDNDGEDKCSTTRFGVSENLSDIINLVNRRAIEWGCDITNIKIVREDVSDDK